MASCSSRAPTVTLIVTFCVLALSPSLSNAVTDVKAEVHDLIRRTLLTDQTDDAFYVINMDTVHRQITRWKYYLPRVHFQYAMKANPLPALLELVIASGGGFDCASMYEIADVLARGHSPDNIIYGHTVKPIQALKFAQKYGVKKMTLDAESEIVKIAKHFPEATPLIRLKVSDIGATLPLGKKFGTPPRHVPKLIQLAKFHKLNFVGVAFHVGSNISDPDLFPQAFNLARQVFDMAEQEGMRFTHLDIGGGFPSAQRDPAVFEAEAAAINSAIDQYFPNTDPRFEHLQIFSEPGRYFAGEFPLVSRVIGVKTHEDTDERKQMVFLNEGFHGVFHGIYGFHLPIQPVVVEMDPEKPKERQWRNATLYGPTWDGHDVIKDNFMMPEVQTGDAVMFPEVGAYTETMASTFEGRPMPYHVFYMSKEVETELELMSRWPRVKAAMVHHTREKQYGVPVNSNYNL